MRRIYAEARALQSQLSTAPAPQAPDVLAVARRGGHYKFTQAVCMKLSLPLSPRMRV